MSYIPGQWIEGKSTIHKGDMDRIEQGIATVETEATNQVAAEAAARTAAIATQHTADIAAFDPMGAASGATATALQKAANLSDVASASASLTNLSGIAGDLSTVSDNYVPRWSASIGKAVFKALPRIDAAADYGVKANDSTIAAANSTALNLAITTLAASGSPGGTIQLPPGQIYLNGTITIPVDRHIQIEGTGISHSGGTRWGTVLYRATGFSGDMISAVGTGANSGQRCFTTLANLGINGNSVASVSARFARVTDLILDHVRFSNSGSESLVMTNVWNALISNCFFHTSGNGNTTACVRMDAPTGEDGCNGNFFNNCQWEGNNGIGLKITGTVNWSIVNHFTNCKWEDALASTWPLIELDQAAATIFNACWMMKGKLNGNVRATGPLVKLLGSAPTNDGERRANIISASQLSYWGDTAQLIQHDAGVLSVVGCSFTGIPTTAYIAVGSAVGANDSLIASNYYEHTNLGFQDLRSGKRVNPAVAGEVTFNILDYGATIASANNKAAIDLAIAAANAASGGVIYFPPGTWKTAGGHTVYSNITFAGAGKTTTTIQLANASNVDLFQSQSFGTNTGGTGSGGPTHWGFHDLTLDGNGANQSATSWPLRVFGRSYTLQGVDIMNGYSGCFWTEWGNGGSDMESLVINCKFHDNLAGDTVSNYGPHDAKWAHSMIYHCGSVTPGRGLVLGTNAGAGQNGANGTVHTDVHLFGYGTTGVEVGSGGVIFENCIAEGFTGANGNVFFNTASNGSAWHGGMIFGTNSSGETGFTTAAGVQNVTLDNPYMFNFGTGSWIFNFGNGGHNSYKAQVKIATATIFNGAGYVGASDNVDIFVMDTTASSLNSMPYQPTYRNGLAVTAGTFAIKNSSTDQFSVVPTTGRVALPNNAFLSLYKDNYTTKTAGIDGATGYVQPGTAAGAGAHIYSGSGAPTISATSGDLYFRTDTPTASSQRVYICTGTTNWVPFYGSISVKDFGATGDGITDDTAAVQAALDAAKATGGEVLIPSGTYIVSNLSLDYTNDTAQNPSGTPYGYRAPSIRGVGNRVPILQQEAAATGVILTVQGKTGSNAGPGHNNKISGLSISNLEIVGVSTGSHGLYLRSLVGCSFTNLLIRNCGGSGVYLARETFVSGVNDEYAYDLTFTNVKCMVNTRWGFECSGTNSISATLTGCDASSNTLGGYLVAPTNWTMTGCVAIGNSAGVNTGYGLKAVRNTNSASTNNTLLLSGCRFEGNSASGGYDVRIDGGYGYVLEGCTFFSTGGAHSVGIGIAVAGSGSYVQSPLINGGYFGGDGATTTAKAIVTASDCRNLLVINPRFDYTTWGTGGNTTPNSLITDNGATTSVIHSQNLLPNAAGYIDYARKITTPGASPAGMARMYIKDSANLAGKTQFAVKFPSGAEQILASEPENGVDPKRTTWSTVAPTAGTWAVGDICYNSAPASGATTGWVCTVAGTPGTWVALPVLGSSAISVFTSGGSYTVPVGVKSFDFYTISGGCGGGSGSTAASGTASYGGGGGACGAATIAHAQASEITDATLTVTVGAGGTGGAAISATSTSGNNGANGGDSKVVGATSAKVFGFATQASADNVTNLAGGRGGTTSSGAGGTAQAGTPWSSTSSAGGSSISAAATFSSRGNTPGSGGGGGGVSATPAFFGGGAAYVPLGRNDLFPTTTKLNGGSTTGQVGVAGTTVNPTLTVPPASFGVGGSGGAASITVNGGDGGAGGLYGGGGGGGGACLNGSTSGKGGDGGTGIVVIVARY
jgi:hypothetical protein